MLQPVGTLPDGQTNRPIGSHQGGAHAMDIKPFFVIVLPIVTVLAVGLLGGTRRIGFWLALILGVVLTPIGGFLVALLSGQRKPKQPRRAKADKP
jgi:hypothetical protein